MAGARRIFCTVICACALHAADANAFGVRYPEPVREASAWSGDVLPLVTRAPRAWSFEVAEQERFGGLGLRVGGARAELSRGRWQLCAEAAQMRADVGRDSRVSGRLAYAVTAWSLGVSFAHDSAVVGASDASTMTTLGLTTRVCARGRVHVRCDVDGYRIAGLEYPGADVETGVLVVAAEGVALSTTLVVDRLFGAHARFGAALLVFEHAALFGGYDDATASFSVALSVDAARARAGVGATMHPVLGISRGFSLGWSR